MHHDPPSDLFAHTLTIAAPAMIEIYAGHVGQRRNLKKLL